MLIRLEAKLNLGHHMLPRQFGFVEVRLWTWDGATILRGDDVAACKT